MARADFASSAEYHADAQRRAEALLNSQIARIDAALAFVDQRAAAYLPSIRDNLEQALNAFRAKAVWYLEQPASGATALGMMGPNGRGPFLDRLIAQVDFHANRKPYRATSERRAAA